jgi:hypothetical protein
MQQGISFMQYMRAHGNTPMPTQRPWLTGAISGLLAGIPAACLLWFSGACASVAQALGLNIWMMLLLDTLLLTLGGMLYAMIFKRAAHDSRGGWLFGISYGFLLWMLGPTTVWQWLNGNPLVVGYPAMGLFGAQLLYGLALGLIYPWIHLLVQAKLSGVSKAPRALPKSAQASRATEPPPAQVGQLGIGLKHNEGGRS